MLLIIRLLLNYGSVKQITPLSSQTFIHSVAFMNEVHTLICVCDEIKVIIVILKASDKKVISLTPGENSDVCVY